MAIKAFGLKCLIDLCNQSVKLFSMIVVDLLTSNLIHSILNLLLSLNESLKIIFYPQQILSKLIFIIIVNPR